MSWSEYVTRHLAGRTQQSLAELVGVSQGAVSRWKKGTQGVDAPQAIRFARAVADNPLRALVEAGFLEPEEVLDKPERAPDFNQLSNDELLELVRARMTEEVVGNGDHPAPNTEPDLGPVLKPHFPKVEPWEVDVAAREDRPGPKKR